MSIERCSAGLFSFLPTCFSRKKEKDGRDGRALPALKQLSLMTSDIHSFTFGVDPKLALPIEAFPLSVLPEASPSIVFKHSTICESYIFGLTMFLALKGDQ